MGQCQSAATTSEEPCEEIGSSRKPSLSSRSFVVSKRASGAGTGAGVNVVTRESVNPSLAERVTSYNRQGSSCQSCQEANREQMELDDSWAEYSCQQSNRSQGSSLLSSTRYNSEHTSEALQNTNMAHTASSTSWGTELASGESGRSILETSFKP